MSVTHNGHDQTWPDTRFPENWGYECVFLGFIRL